MKDELFDKIIMLIIILGSLSVVALTVWTICLYNDCSIIAFIANGG